MTAPANPESAAREPLRERVEQWLRDNVDDEGQICLCADPECFQETASSLTAFIDAATDSLIETAIERCAEVARLSCAWFEGMDDKDRCEHLVGEIRALTLASIKESRRK